MRYLAYFLVLITLGGCTATDFTSATAQLEQTTEQTTEQPQKERILVVSKMPNIWHIKHINTPIVRKATTSTVDISAWQVNDAIEQWIAQTLTPHYALLRDTELRQTAQTPTLFTFQAPRLTQQAWLRQVQALNVRYILMIYPKQSYYQESFDTSLVGRKLKGLDSTTMNNWSVENIFNMPYLI